VIPAGSGTQLSFRHSSNFEGSAFNSSCFDGELLQISTDGTNYSNVTSVGGTFSQGGYDQAINSDPNNPLNSQLG